jgi:hypothetical protein
VVSLQSLRNVFTFTKMGCICILYLHVVIVVTIFVAVDLAIIVFVVVVAVTKAVLLDDSRAWIKSQTVKRNNLSLHDKEA